MTLEFESFKDTPWSGRTTKFLLFVADMSIAAVSLAAAVFFAYDLSLPTVSLLYSWPFLIFMVVKAGAFLFFGTYNIIIRYIGERDTLSLVKAMVVSSVCNYVLSFWLPPVGVTKNLLTILWVDLFLGVLGLSSLRFMIRLLYDRLKLNTTGTVTAIFGAGELGAMLAGVIKSNTSHGYRLVAFFDDNPKVHRKMLNGIRVYNPEKVFGEVIRKEGIKTIILGINHLPARRRVAFVEQCLELGIKVLKIPPPESWMDGNPHPGQFTKINVDDLLNRAPIELDQSLVNDSVREKIVLVTGCAGSIGSEIVRQLLRYEPALVIGIDQAESPLAALSLELKKHVDVGTFVPIIGNVCDLVKMERLMKTFRPEYVFHAAAYKHVPIMEVFPEEAIKTNVQGTRNMADLSVQFDVSKFVMISTDKVIKPSNVMGASKRIAEMYVQSLNFASHSKTHFITTRFGNVLGSNGSVIPIFNSQINALLPITITHPEVSRYFMTIPEACQLVLEAGSFGNGGEIFIFDMGEPVYILELAKRMIQMAGLTPYVDIPILITGLRPGEKLTEELLADSENTIPTHHPKIKKASVRLVSYQEVLPIIDRLIAAANEQQTASDIVTLMKELVPEFESQNSVFEYLDKRKDHYYSTA